MEKLDPKIGGASLDIVDQNIEELKHIFHDVFTEGKVDFDVLRETLGEYIDDRPERYSFTWNGKSQARRIAQTPSTGTLRPCPKESVDWDTTRNLFIEGDNLEVLKLLQKSYHKKIKLIYIDPPYNTGSEFIYPDKFQDNLDTYLRYTGQKNEDGLKLSANTETSGRYHTNWLNMMLPRLKLARNLLRDDGVIFISIDENEIANLKKLCDEVFGEEDFIACIANVNNPKGRSDDKYIARAHEYILVYKKRDLNLQGWEPGPHILRRYNKFDAKGQYREIDLRKTGDNDRRIDRPNLFYYFLYNEKTGEFYPTREETIPQRYVQIVPTRTDDSEGNWRWELESAAQKIDILIPKFMPQRKKWSVFEKDYLGPDKREKPTSAWTHKFANSERGTEQFIELGFEKQVFPFPKPVGLIQAMIQIASEGNDIILDFFAGSCSTAHAMLLQNSNDKVLRNFIMVQLPEPCDDKSEAYKAGYQTIADIGKERIRRVINKIHAEQEEKAKSAEDNLSGNMGRLPDLDIGFKVFKLDASNIKPWDVDFDNLEDTFFTAVENIKPDRSEADMLYELLLKYGLDLSVPIEERKISKNTVYVIGAGALVVCLSKQISLEIVEGIAALKDELKPEVMRVVFKDSGFADDVVKTNAVQILRQAGIDDVKSL